MTTPQEAVAGLRDAVASPLSRNDLGRLAQMHSWGQVLGEAKAVCGNPPVDEARVSLANTMVQLLERIILDEAADPDAGLTTIPDMVTALEQTVQGEAVDAGPLLARAAAAIGGGGAPATPAAAPPAVAAPATAPSVAEAPPPAPVAAAPPAPVVVAPPAAAVAPPPVQPVEAAPVAQPIVDEQYVSEPLMLDLEEREHLEGFLEEATEHMDVIEGGLLEVESHPDDTEKLNELFRPFHTIKGIAGFLNLRDINRLTHEIETILDMGRRGEMKLTSTTVDLFFTAVDMLKAQLGAIREFMADPRDEACPQPDISAVMAQLRRAAAGLQDLVVPPTSVAAAEVANVATGAIASTSELAGDTADEAIVAGPAAESQRAPTEGSKLSLDSSIRVDTAKLDSLVDAVGELVIAQSMVNLSNEVRGDAELARNVAQVTKIVRDVQETAMAMRMVPIGHTFQKMRRLARDVSRKAAKTVDLTINGEETELDKNVIQQISDPLVHLVRNAVDHGIEPPDVRRSIGKPEVGQVELNAFHQGDSIVIEIRDDGKGLDPEKLIAKGIERGLITPEDQLSEQQAYALILQPGFSTAEKITDISGRGVGLDVVKRNVEQLRGKIEIESEIGKGSVFSIRLPLTLAIIDGMLVRVGSERLIIPTIMIEQSLRPERRQITSVQHRGEMLQVRGELCPLIQLGAIFHYTDVIDPCDNLVVIVQCEGQKIALVVEELIGQQQVVIKSLGERFKKLSGISGAAILGDGHVGLILEPGGLLALHNCTDFSHTTMNHRREAPRKGTTEPTQPADDAAADEPEATAEEVTESEPVLSPA